MQGMVTNAVGNTPWTKAVLMRSFWQRLVGLIPRRGISHYEAYWFPQCQHIHTYGMRFPLDVIALDEHDRICAVVRNLQPNQRLHIASASSLIEIAAGCRYPLEQWRGEPLYFKSQS